MLTIGYYDGATHGVVECRKCGATYYFAVVWQENINDDLGDVRVFAVAPIGQPAAEVSRTYLGADPSVGTFDFPGGEEGDRYLAWLESLPPLILVAARSIDSDFLAGKAFPGGGIGSISNWREWFGEIW